MLKRYSREPSVTSSVTFAEMTGKSVIYFKGISSLIEAQKLRGAIMRPRGLCASRDQRFPP